MTDERLIVSFHEAGHTVCALCVGIRVESAQLFDEGWWDGQSGWNARTRYAGCWKRVAPIDDVVVSLAGPIAESIISERHLLDVLREGGKTDLARAQAEARCLHRCGLYKTPDHALLVAERRARALLAMHWAKVIEVARELYTQGRID